jgi:hypothetical protein
MFVARGMRNYNAVLGLASNRLACASFNVASSRQVEEQHHLTYLIAPAIFMMQNHPGLQFRLLATMLYRFIGVLVISDCAAALLSILESLVQETTCRTAKETREHVTLNGNENGQFHHANAITIFLMAPSMHCRAGQYLSAAE